MDHYWIIELWNGEKIRVQPKNASAVQDRVARGDGFLKTPEMTINVKDIKNFNKSDEIYTDQKLLGDASRAFGEPVAGEDGAVQATWVKKAVPKRRWENFYRFNEAYRIFEDVDPNMVLIMFKVPTHLLSESVTPLSDAEIIAKNLSNVSS